MTKDQKMIYYTFETPNTWKISILLEELKLKYDNVDYEARKIDLTTGEQKQEWFLKLNPNGRVPVLVDGDVTAWDSGSILLYLTSKYDPFDHFTVKSHTPAYANLLSHLFFSASHLSPISIEANHFASRALVKSTYAINRYNTEINRIYSTLEKVLSDEKPDEDGNKWLVGSKYTIADIMSFPWVRAAIQFEINIDEYPEVKKWASVILEREGVKKGLAVPTPTSTPEERMKGYLERRANVMAMEDLNAK